MDKEEIKVPKYLEEVMDQLIKEKELDITKLNHNQKTSLGILVQRTTGIIIHKKDEKIRKSTLIRTTPIKIVARNGSTITIEIKHPEPVLDVI